MPNPAGVQYRPSRDTRCPVCGKSRHPICHGVCTTCGATEKAHPKCGACSIFVGKGHEAEEQVLTLYSRRQESGNDREHQGSHHRGLCLGG